MSRPYDSHLDGGFPYICRINGICTIYGLYGRSNIYLRITLESTVGVAKAGTKSLRAKLPQGIVSYLNLKPGDKIEWTMNDRSNERMVMVSKKMGNPKKPLDEAFQFEHLSA